MPPEPDPSNPRVMPRGSSSQEKTIQEEREQSALSAVYVTSSQIPDSPAEPADVITEEEASKDAKAMELGEEFTNQFFPNGLPDTDMSMAVDGTDVSSLIGQLSAGTPNAMGLDSGISNALAGFQPEQVQQLLAQLSSTMGITGQQPTPNQNGTHGDGSAWGNAAVSHQFPDYGYSEDDDQQFSRWEDRSGRGGRGRGAGKASRGRGDDWGGKPYNRKSRPCLFFQQQRRASNLISRHSLNALN